MAEYQELRDTATVLRRADQAYIPDDPANIDRQAYDDWLADGNQPDPAAPLVEASPADALVTRGYVDDALAALTRRIEALERNQDGRDPHQ